MDDVTTELRVPVVTPVRVGSRWHINLYRVARNPASKSGVVLGDPEKISSSASLIQAAGSIADLAPRHDAMIIMPDPSDANRWLAICHEHQIIARNTTMQYAAESAFWHVSQQH